MTPEIGEEKCVKMFNFEPLNLFDPPTLINVARQVFGEITHPANTDSTASIKACRMWQKKNNVFLNEKLDLHFKNKG